MDSNLYVMVPVYQMAFLVLTRFFLSHGYRSYQLDSNILMCIQTSPIFPI